LRLINVELLMNEEVPLNESTDVVPPESVPEQTVDVEQTPQSAGALLTTHREARGWTIAQVANQLNLAARQIDALERNAYEALPGMVIVRGFIRAYAKLLQVDAAPILALVKGDSGTANVLPPPRSAMSASFSDTQLLSESRRRGFPIKLIAGVVVLLMIAGLIIFEGKRMGWMHGSSAESTTKMHEELTQTEEPAAVEQSTSAVSESEVPPQAQESTSSVAAPAAVAATSASQVIASTNTVPLEVKNPVAAPDSKNVLAINAHQDSWVEIKRADNTVLASNLLKAGTAESFELSGPVSIVIGNAAGVKVTLRGASVDVTGNSSNVARLNLK
jgi:cytoskeleton protein RodZ